MSHFSVPAQRPQHVGEFPAFGLGRGSRYQLPRVGWVQRHLPNSRCSHPAGMPAPSPASPSPSKPLAWSSIRGWGPANPLGIFHPDLPHVLLETRPGQPRRHSWPPRIYPALTRDAGNPDRASATPNRIRPRDKATLGRELPASVQRNLHLPSALTLISDAGKDGEEPKASATAPTRTARALSSA